MEKESTYILTFILKKSGLKKKFCNTKVQKVLQRGYKLAQLLLDQSDFSNLHNSQI